MGKQGPEGLDSLGEKGAVLGSNNGQNFETQAGAMYLQ